LPGWELRGQGVELFGRRVALFDSAFQLVFPQHVHELNPSQGLLGGAERREPQLGMGDSLHAAMIRYHNRLSDSNGTLMPSLALFLQYYREALLPSRARR
jgi:hypothetical protein